MKTTWVSVLLAVLLSGGCLGSKCPPEEDLKPHCWCLDSYYGGALFCEDFNSPSEVVHPIEACQGYNVTALGIFNSTLLYFPRDVFRGTIFVKITLFNTVLMSLSNGPLAFEGLEDTMEELRASRTQYVTQWRISQLRELKKMETIDINHIHLEVIDEDFPEFPNLVAVGLVHAGLTYLGDTTFAKCEKLRILDLRHNYISELKRSMLPKPSGVIIMNLEGNELSTFSEDFFTDMPELQEVLLADNQFTTIPEIVFVKIFKKLNTLNLAGNPIRCDCRLSWLVKGMRPPYFEAQCDYPPSLKGEHVRYLSKRHLQC